MAEPTPLREQPPLRPACPAAAGLRPLVLLALALALLVLAGCRDRGTQLPIPMDDLLPTGWRVHRPEGKRQVLQPLSIDGDSEQEWLLFYHFDNVEGGANGPIGGIIYDAQQDAARYDPQTVIPFPYQPSAFLVPYRLLPDWRFGKGQGYLGNDAVQFEVVSAVTPRRGEESTGQELVVFGKQRGAVTRVSIFRWVSPQEGYASVHFVGSHRVEIGPREALTLVREVTTFDMLSERSNLCKRTTYQRQGDALTFNVVSPPAIVFCQGTPAEPTYPEAVVLAWLLNSPGAARNALVAPGREGQVNAAGPASVLRVLSLTYDSTAMTLDVGQDAVSRMAVQTTVEVPGPGRRVYRWTLQERKPQAVRDTSRWLILDVAQVP
ncbi:MAG: hypothetical protein NZ528_10020 [Caldilineales bacterium]|nr:hypothetical protein [Caldilineales bacterium]MDW8316653.1 hypothetical protein [Anaerolineae bacterium]